MVKIIHFSKNNKISKNNDGKGKFQLVIINITFY